MPSLPLRSGVASQLADEISSILRNVTGPTVTWLGWSIPRAGPKKDSISSIVELIEIPRGDLSGSEPERAAGRSNSLVLAGVLFDDSLTEARLRSLVEAIQPEGRLFFVEPTMGLGLAAAVHRIGAPVVERGFGFHHRTDVPVVIRNTGIQITTLHRFHLGPSWLGRTFVAGEARWYSNLP